MSLIEKISKKEKISYGLAGLGQNMIYNFSAAYIMIFYTDIMKLLPAAVGTLMLIARVWDAINDPIMGSIVDNTKTKWGKLRPYLLAVPIPLAVFTILTFYNPDLNASTKLIYAYTTYIGWGMIYTVSDVPYWGLTAVMTPNSKERLSILSFARVLSNVGLAVAIILSPFIISAFDGSATGYLVTAVIMSIIGAALFFLAFLNTKERVVNTSQKQSLFKNLAAIKQNKPLLLLQSSRLLGAFRMGLAAAGTYFAKYNLNDELYYSLLGGVLIISMILALLLTPTFSKVIKKKTLYQSSLILQAIAHLVLFFIGYQNLYLVFGLLFVVGFAMGINDIIMYNMVIDSIDYLQAKTNKRYEGVSFSLHTFTTKLQTAFALFAIGAILNGFGFIENTIQSTRSLSGIFLLLTVLPALASILSLVPMIFYDLDEDQHKMILQQLQQE